MYWSHHHKSTNKKSSGLLTHYCLPVHIFSCPMNNIMNGKIGSWTLHLRTLHLRMLYLRHFIFRKLHLRRFHLLEVTPSGYFTFWMLHLRDVSPSGCFTFGQLHLQRFHPRTFSETLEGVILQSCNVQKVKLPEGAIS